MSLIVFSLIIHTNLQALIEEIYCNACGAHSACLGGDTSCMFGGPMCGGGVFLEGLSITYNHYLATLEEPLFLHKGEKSAILSSLFYL